MPLLKNPQRMQGAPSHLVTLTLERTRSDHGPTPSGGQGPVPGLHSPPCFLFELEIPLFLIRICFVTSSCYITPYGLQTPLGEGPCFALLCNSRDAQQSVLYEGSA